MSYDPQAVLDLALAKAWIAGYQAGDAHTDGCDYVWEHLHPGTAAFNDVVARVEEKGKKGMSYDPEKESDEQVRGMHETWRQTEEKVYLPGVDRPIRISDFVNGNINREDIEHLFPDHKGDLIGDLEKAKHVFDEKTDLPSGRCNWSACNTIYPHEHHPDGALKSIQIPRARPTWEDYFLAIAKAVALRADCTRRQVGAVIVDHSNHIIGTGYNGGPAGGKSCLKGECPRGLMSKTEVTPGSSYDTGTGACIALHAEQNALLHSDVSRRAGASIFITCEPCDGCWRELSGSGLRYVYYSTDDSGLPGHYFKAEWLGGKWT